MEQFSTREGHFKGHPVLEILIDGVEWGNQSAHDERFQFGLTKAQMILTVRDAIELFVVTKGERPDHEIRMTVSREDVGISCTVTAFPEFRSRGRRIHEPYLKLESGLTELGLGLRKCDAILSVEDKLWGFLDKYMPIDDEA